MRTASFAWAPTVDTLKSGRVNPKANIKVLQRSPATALVDGDNGIGHLVMTYAANLAVELARDVRASAGSARGTPITPAPPASTPRCRSRTAWSASTPRCRPSNHMAPWGGAEALMGTNPIAIAIPAGKEAPVRARHRHLGVVVRQHPAASGRRQADAGRLGGAQQDRRADHRSEEGVGGRAAADRRPQGQRACADDRTAGRRAERRRVRPRRGRFHRARHGADQHRAVRDRARCRALHRAGGVRGRDGPPSQRSALVADVAGLRRRSGCRARSAASAAPTAARTACNCRRR